MEKKFWMLFVLMFSLCSYGVILSSRWNSRKPTPRFLPAPAQAVPAVNKSRRFPDAIVIGVKKGGTRALLQMLSSHPNIEIAEEEIHFFSRKYNNGLNWYLGQMPLVTKNTIVMEKSPSYFVSNEAAKRIHAQGMPVKLILIVRNPVDRTVSDYIQVLTKERNLPKFENYVMKQTGEVNVQDKFHIISRSLYDVHYQRWLQWFNKSQILVLNGDQLIKDPVSVLKEAERFLNLKEFFNSEMFFFDEGKGFFCWNVNNSSSMQKHCLGSSKGRSHPTVNTTVVDKLNQYYRQHIAIFCHLASVTFPWCIL